MGVEETNFAHWYGNYTYSDDVKVLHCHGWKLPDILTHLDTIANQGFNAIQINPIQPLKEDIGMVKNGKLITSIPVWMSYQPIDFTIGNSYGSKNDLIKLCQEAEKRGIKIIQDVVCNHLAGRDDGSLYPHELVNPEIASNPMCWKEPKNVSNWNNRNEVVNLCMGLPGLNLNNQDIQKRILNFLNDLIDCGVGGFRFDAAKSIGLPEEGYNFWPNVIQNLKKRELILYGEVIFETEWLIDQYSKYMYILTNEYNGINKDSILNFAESHDTYYDFKYTKDRDSMDIVHEYKERSKRFNNMLFFTREFDDSWKSDEVREANKRNVKVLRR